MYAIENTLHYTAVGSVQGLQQDRSGFSLTVHAYIVFDVTKSGGFLAFKITQQRQTDSYSPQSYFIKPVYTCTVYAVWP